MRSVVRLILRPFRAFRSRLIGPTTGQIADLRAENRELRRRVDEITSLLDDGLTTLSRTGQALRSVELRAPGPSTAAAAAPAAPDAAGEDGPGRLRTSVVICTLDRPASLAACLSAVQGLDPWPFEVVVVNGPSSDETAALLATWGDRIKVANCSVHNIAAARNLGIAAAAGEIVAFLDDDTYPEPSWLAELVGGLGPANVAVGGEVRNRAGTDVETLHLIGSRLGHTLRLPGLDPTRWYASPYSERFIVLPGGNSAYRREALVAIGGFDEAFEYGGEEADLDLRLRDAGLGLGVVPAAVVYHQALANADRTADGVVQDRYRFMRSKAYFVLKHATATHSPSEIADSHVQTVERFRAERRAAIDAGLLDRGSLDRLDDEAARALVDGESLWRERGPQLRSRDWFGGGSQPYLPFATVGRPPRIHECILLGPGVALSLERARETEQAALDGAIVRIVRVAPGPGSVTIAAGVWRHDVADPGGADQAAAERAVTAEVQRIHAARPIDRIRSIGAPAGWIAALRSNGLRVEPA